MCRSRRMWKVPADKLSTTSAHNAPGAPRGSKQLVTAGRACRCALMHVLRSPTGTLSAQTPTNVRGLAACERLWEGDAE
jgi:hypothetical protein